MKDVFGRDVKVGDTIAAGMNLDRSSGLRVGKVIKVTERIGKEYSGRHGEVVGWTVRVRWTHNGDREGKGYRHVTESNILGAPHYYYAKFVILPEGFVDEFPPDVKDD
jgi:hypothetical protein